MPAPALFRFEILFHKSNTIVPTWRYSGPVVNGILQIYEGDKIKFVFVYLDEPTQPTILNPKLDAVPIPAGEPGAPFNEGLHLDLKQPIATAGPLQGHWGFSVSFAVNWPGVGTVAYYLPDPELQVGPKPGECAGL